MSINIYSRLYKYRETPAFSPLENFITEALADIFNRLPMSGRIGFLVWILPNACTDQLRNKCNGAKHIEENKCKGAKHIEAKTQVPIIVAGTEKRPDIIIYLDTKPLVLIEAKVNAPVHNHNRDGLRARQPRQSEISDNDVQNQLETYSNWMRSQWQLSDDWPGAVVFLTHGTRAPEGFENNGCGDNTVIRVTRTWSEIGRWLGDNLDLKQSQMAHCALASDFNHFLGVQGLMENFITSHDIAATGLFLPSFAALNYTFDQVIRAVDNMYPQLRGGRINQEFWPEGNAYIAWYYLNHRFNHGNQKFGILIGICFPGDRMLECDDLAGIPQHEPFFFIMINGDAEINNLLEAIPEGWAFIYEGSAVVNTKPVSKFEADPDKRAEQLITWAQEQVAKAVARIPNFAAAPIEDIPDQPDD